MLIPSFKIGTTLALVVTLISAVSILKMVPTHAGLLVSLRAASRERAKGGQVKLIESGPKELLSNAKWNKDSTTPNG
jgi:hypothetical protein